MTLIEELKALCEADLSLRITDAAEYSRIETNALKQKIRYILSRHQSTEQEVILNIDPGYVQWKLNQLKWQSHQSESEPLAVMANRLGYWKTKWTNEKDENLKDYWSVELERTSFNIQIARQRSEHFNGKTYQEAESQARKYLLSLPDREDFKPKDDKGVL